VFVTHDAIVGEITRTIEEHKFVEIRGLVNDVIKSMEAPTLNCDRSPLELEHDTRVTTNLRNRSPISELRQPLVNEKYTSTNLASTVCE